MRSRYAAYAVGDLDHVFRTWHPRTRPDDLTGRPGPRPGPASRSSTRRPAGPDDETGEVEFARTTDRAAAPGVLHERSRFERRAGRWVYVDGRGHDRLTPGAAPGGDLLLCRPGRSAPTCACDRAAARPGGAGRGAGDPGPRHHVPPHRRDPLRRGALGRARHVPAAPRCATWSSWTPTAPAAGLLSAEQVLASLGTTRRAPPRRRPRPGRAAPGAPRGAGTPGRRGDGPRAGGRAAGRRRHGRVVGVVTWSDIVAMVAGQHLRGGGGRLTGACRPCDPPVRAGQWGGQPGCGSGTTATMQEACSSTVDGDRPVDEARDGARVVVADHDHVHLRRRRGPGSRRPARGPARCARARRGTSRSSRSPTPRAAAAGRRTPRRWSGITRAPVVAPWASQKQCMTVSGSRRSDAWR